MTTNVENRILRDAITSSDLQDILGWLVSNLDGMDEHRNFDTECTSNTPRGND